jgi:hypothetical protein
LKLAFKQSLTRYLQSMYQTIDNFVAILLLTGQITIRSSIISTGGEIRLSLTGPIFGGQRTEAMNRQLGAAVVLDAFDIITALLLIIGELSVVGVMLQSQRFNLIIGGPILGSRKVEAYVPETVQFLDGYKELLLKRYQNSI